MDDVLFQALKKDNSANIDSIKKHFIDNDLDYESAINFILNSDMVNESAFLEQIALNLEINWLKKVISKNFDKLRKIFPASLALQSKILPIFLDKKKLQIACYNPFDLLSRQRINKLISNDIETINWQMTTRSNIFTGLQKLYGVGGDTFEKILAEKGGNVDNEVNLREDTNVLDEDNKEASVMRFVNQIIKEALKQRATDIHVEPVKNNLRIRYRIDGVLLEVPVPNQINALQSSVLSRLKVMSRLDIAEKRRPQDGRIRLQLEDKEIDVRVACIPSVEGESISLRLLGQENFTIEKINFLSTAKRQIKRLIAQPNGIIVATGPTGAGKSTTLYSFLEKLNQPGRKIVTIEDPVEHKINGIVQIAVNPEINVTFANGLRSILRGDPDIVMIGEMRDTETAEIAIRAALTGHLVFSTLHANDSISGIARLLDMGLEPFLVAASVRAFIAQSLVRKLCKNCKQEFSPDKEQLELFSFKKNFSKKIFKAKANGCSYCRNTGYFGRLAIYEICELSPAIQDLVTKKAHQSEILTTAANEGFKNLRHYGWEKILNGETSIEEVLSVTKKL